MKEVSEVALAVKFKSYSNIFCNLSQKQTVNVSRTKIFHMHSQELLGIHEENSQVDLPGEEQGSFFPFSFPNISIIDIFDSTVRFT